MTRLTVLFADKFIVFIVAIIIKFLCILVFDLLAIQDSNFYYCDWLICFRISSLEIVCLTPAFNLNSEHLHESGIFAGGPVNVSIDSAMLGISDVVYTYKDDPVITLLYPRRSIFRFVLIDWLID